MASSPHTRIYRPVRNHVDALVRAMLVQPQNIPRILDSGRTRAEHKASDFWLIVHRQPECKPGLAPNQLEGHARKALSVGDWLRSATVSRVSERLLGASHSRPKPTKGQPAGDRPWHLIERC